MYGFAPQAYALFMMLIYPFGTPLLYSAVLWRHRREIRIAFLSANDSAHAPTTEADAPATAKLSSVIAENVKQIEENAKQELINKAAGLSSSAASALTALKGQSAELVGSRRTTLSLPAYIQQLTDVYEVIICIGLIACHSDNGFVNQLVVLGFAVELLLVGGV